MLKEYAMYFTAYFFNNLGEDNKNVVKVILFGSVARDDYEKDSDIDLFIEVKKKTEKLEKKIKKITESFYNSREASLFKLKGANNKISLKIGRLSEWEDLERSIASTGIILYAPYETMKLPSGIKHYLIIFWSKIGKNRGAFLNRLYGFKIKNKRYEGLISKLNGKKLGKSCIMMPIKYRKDILDLLKEYKVEAKLMEVFNEN